MRHTANTSFEIVTSAPLKKSWLGTCDQQGFIKERGQENMYYVHTSLEVGAALLHVLTIRKKNMQSHYIAVWRKIERSNKFKAISLF